MTPSANKGFWVEMAVAATGERFIPFKADGDPAEGMAGCR